MEPLIVLLVANIAVACVSIACAVLSVRLWRAGQARERAVSRDRYLLNRAMVYEHPRRMR